MLADFLVEAVRLSPMFTPSPLWDAELKDSARGLAAIESELLDATYASSLVHAMPEMCLPKDFLVVPRKLDALRGRSDTRKLSAAAGLMASRNSPSDRAATAAALLEEHAVACEQVRQAC